MLSVDVKFQNVQAPFLDTSGHKGAGGAVWRGHHPQEPLVHNRRPDLDGGEVDRRLRGLSSEDLHPLVSEERGGRDLDLGQAGKIGWPSKADDHFQAHGPVTTGVSVRPPHSLHEPS
jgi:hypothetical protein